ncbi:hypothetical protein [Lysinibacillus odysseyi]|nr:hypothetical protein [Lysinibacillus odysseyi]
MMYGSFLYNCWAALLGFSAYFALALQQPYAMPLKTLIGSFVTALVVFLFAYPVRLLLGYVLFTPEEVTLAQVEKAKGKQEQKEELQIPDFERNPAMEFEDENGEEIAKVVRTMMHSEEQTLPNH